MTGALNPLVAKTRVITIKAIASVMINIVVAEPSVQRRRADMYGVDMIIAAAAAG